MPIITPTNIFESEVVLIFVKGAILILLLFYAIFALLIVRQVDLMSKTLITQIAPVIKLLSVIHALFAVGLIFLTFFIL